MRISSAHGVFDVSSPTTNLVATSESPEVVIISMDESVGFLHGEDVVVQY